MTTRPIHWKNKQLAYRVAEYLAAIFRSGILIVCLYWLYLNNYLWFIVGTLFFVITLVPRIAIQNNKLRVITDTSISLLCCTHIVLGMYSGFYENYSLYDKLMHVLGSALLTLLITTAVVQYCKHNKLILPLSLHIALVLGVTISLGTLWELFEFTVDQTGLFYSQRGLQDTMLDLVANIAGISGAMFIHLKISARQKTLTPLGE